MSRASSIFCLTAAAVSCAGAFGSANGAPVATEPGFERSEVVAAEVGDCRREEFTLRSPVMDRSIGVVILLPPGYDANTGRDYPILYALHGRGAPYGSWASMPPLQQRLKDRPMIVACFDAGYASLYLDAAGDGLVEKRVTHRQPRGKKKHHTDEQYRKLEQDWTTTPARVKSLYTTFFLKEFIPAIDHLYRVDKANRAVAGFSMGGFGAMHYALQQPGLFRSISGLSALIYDDEALADSLSRGRSSLPQILGDYEGNKGAYRLVNHFKRTKELIDTGGTLPPVYLHCGQSDRLAEVNRTMRDALQELGCQVVYKESQGGHNWTFWKGASAGVIDFHWEHFHRSPEETGADGE